MQKFFLFIALGLFFLFPKISFAQTQQPAYIEAKITEIKGLQVFVTVTEGELKDKQLTVHQYDAQQIKKQQLEVGNEVIISYLKDPSGKETVYIIDHIRRIPLLVLFGLFVVIVLFVGRRKGIFSFVAMLLSFVVITQVIIPQILLGNDPVLISMFGALFIIPMSFYISHGFNKHTTVAVISTFFALLITGLLAYIFVNFTRLTGFAAEEATFIQAMKGDTINILSLLLGGIIIGAMGVLDDITISQTSIVVKLAKANPKYNMKELFTHAMDVGRDHIASLVNTLVLVYAGASLPLFVLFYNSPMPFSQIINQEIIATEIVRTLVSSIGIIAAVPITTYLATFVEKKYK